MLDSQKLKNHDNHFGKGYFDELLEQIRDIRSNEKRFYRKITAIYSSEVDYPPKVEETQAFFQIVQRNSFLPQLAIPQPKLLQSDLILKKQYGFNNLVGP
ncbi:MAG: virulence RhuM family protein [Flavobacteriales bacterium]|nr:virulence RhuM family protein [Flavobacteriales bacterium]